jgi:hypothetical protein
LRVGELHFCQPIINHPNIPAVRTFLLSAHPSQPCGQLSELVPQPTRA